MNENVCGFNSSLFFILKNIATTKIYETIKCHNFDGHFRLRWPSNKVLCEPVFSRIYLSFALRFTFCFINEHWKERQQDPFIHKKKKKCIQRKNRYLFMINLNLMFLCRIVRCNIQMNLNYNQKITAEKREKKKDQQINVFLKR